MFNEVRVYDGQGNLKRTLSSERVTALADAKMNNQFWSPKMRQVFKSIATGGKGLRKCDQCKARFVPVPHNKRFCNSICLGKWQHAQKKKRAKKQ